MATCNYGTKLSYFIAGIGLGAVVALIFAPQSGEETRKQIATKAHDCEDFVAAKSKQLRRQAEDLVDHGRDLVVKQKERLADVLESGKQAARSTFAR